MVASFFDHLFLNFGFLCGIVFGGLSLFFQRDG